MSILFRVNHLSKEVSQHKVILNNLSFSLPEKGMIGLVGPSGSGKTTLLNLLSGTDKGEGELFYCGKNLNQMSNKELDLIRNEDFSIIFQNYNLLNDYNVSENISLGAYFQGQKVTRKEISSALEKVNLKGFEKNRLSTLSGGELARVSIARALIRKSRVIFADEITANLDEENARLVLKILKDISQEILVVIATHDPLAMEQCDHSIHLSYGKISALDLALSSEEEMCEYQPKKSAHAGFYFVCKNFKSSFLKSKLLFSCVAILMTALFSLLSTVFSLQQLSSAKAYSSNFKTSEKYIVSTNYYYESNEEWPGFSYKYNGVQMDPSDLTNNTKEKLNLFLNGRAKSAVSYFYSCPFISFFGSGTENVHDDFYTNQFTQIIAFDDFADFSSPLIQGRTPTKDNEVMIYDYAYESLAHFQFIDKHQWDGKLVDVNGRQMNVVGVLKSNYQDYIDYQKKADNHSYILADLFDYSSIICLSSFIQKYENVFSSYYAFDSVEAGYNKVLSTDSDNDYDIINTEFVSTPISLKTKVNASFNLGGYEFEALRENAESYSVGAIISKKTAMAIVGIDSEEEFDSKTFFEEEKKGSESLLDSLQLSVRFNGASYGISLLSDEGCCNFAVLGITKDKNSSEAEIILNDTGNNYCKQNIFHQLSFRNLYCSFYKNWDKNEALINDMILPARKTDEEYEALPKDYFRDGFAVNTGITNIISSAQSHFQTVSDVAQRILYVLIVAMVVFLLYFSFMSIKNNYYHIGVYKTFGLSNLKIALSCLCSGIIICVISFCFSIISSLFVLFFINADFVASFGIGLTFISLTGLSLLLSFFIGIGVLMLGMVIPLLKLIKTKPFSLMKESMK